MGDRLKENNNSIPGKSGAAHAWNIAFNDLKRRFWQSQTDNQNLHAEVKQLKDYISYLVKQNRHLNSLLASKNLSLTKMEENQKTLRDQEKKQDQYLKDVSSKIEDLNAEISLYQKERSKVINENQNFRSTIEQLYKDKKQIENELENLKNIPEISISPTTSTATITKNEVNKEFEDLLSENKHLKTSIHWMSDELNKLKSEKQIHDIQRTTYPQSGCLEEGIGRLNLSQSINTKSMDIAGYINILHNTISVLKHNLSRSLTYLRIVSKTNSLRLDTLPKKDDLLYDSGIVNMEPNNDDQQVNFNIQMAAGNQDQHYPDQSNAEPNTHHTIHKVNSSPELYPSLLQNLQMQQTKTYLNSNHGPVNQYNENLPIAPVRPPRRIPLYEEYSSD
eukprot:TCONS_00014363-protein